MSSASRKPRRIDDAVDARTWPVTYDTRSTAGTRRPGDLVRVSAAPQRDRGGVRLDRRRADDGDVVGVERRGLRDHVHDGRAVTRIDDEAGVPVVGGQQCAGGGEALPVDVERSDHGAARGQAAADGRPEAAALRSDHHGAAVEPEHILDHARHSVPGTNRPDL
jgi:hypothetical protein